MANEKKEYRICWISDCKHCPYYEEGGYCFNAIHPDEHEHVDKMGEGIPDFCSFDTETQYIRWIIRNKRKLLLQLMEEEGVLI